MNSKVNVWMTTPVCVLGFMSKQRTVCEALTSLGAPGTTRETPGFSLRLKVPQKQWQGSSNVVLSWRRAFQEAQWHFGEDVNLALRNYGTKIHLRTKTKVVSCSDGRVPIS